MKQISIVIITCTLVQNLLYSTPAYYSKTFITLPNPYQPGTPEYQNAIDILRWSNDECHFSFETAFLANVSSQPGELGCYFSPSNNCCFVVASDSSTQVTHRDVNAQFFNITQTNFASTVEFRPRFTATGLGMQARLKLFSIHDKKVWLAASSSVQHITTNMRLRETLLSPVSSATDTINTVCSAFNQTNWHYGKICGRQSKTGFADVALQLGCELLKTEDATINGYIGTIIPTGNKPAGCFLFEPIVGNNDHWGIMIGGFSNFCLIGEPQHGLELITSSNGCYLFNNKQVRSFDLYNKPWSRYMNVYLSQDAAQSNTITPGINVFTKCLTVKPHYAIHHITAFAFTTNHVLFELGHYLHARQQESICLASDWSSNIALVGTDEHGTTSKARTIANNYLGTPSTPAADADIHHGSYANISTTDLDLTSAANPGFIENAFFGSCAYHFAEHKHLNYLTFGCAYHFGSTNCFVKHWNVWLKLGITI